MKNLISALMLFVGSFASQANAGVFAIQTSACIDGLYLSVHMGAQAVFEPDKKFVTSWKEKFKSLKDPAMKEMDLPIGVLMQDCSPGMDDLLQKIKSMDPAWKKKLVSRYKPELTPEQAKVLDQQLGLTVKWIEFLKANDFEKEWRHDLLPKAQAQDAAMAKWLESTEGRQTLATLEPLICGASNKCFRGIHLAISGFEGVVAKKMSEDFLIVGSRRDTDMAHLFTGCFGTLYKSDTELPSPQAMKDLTINKESMLFFRRYPQIGFFRRLAGKAALAFTLQKVKAISYPLALRLFIEPGVGGGYTIDPLGGNLFLHLKERSDRGESVSRETVEKFFSDFIKSGLDMHPREFLKTLEPVSGVLGVDSGETTDGYKVKSLIIKNDQPLQVGDVILSVDGVSLTGKGAMAYSEAFVGPAGAVKKLRILRKGKERDLTLKLKNFVSS